MVNANFIFLFFSLLISNAWILTWNSGRFTSGYITKSYFILLSPIIIYGQSHYDKIRQDKAFRILPQKSDSEIDLFILLTKVTEILLLRNTKKFKWFIQSYIVWTSNLSANGFQSVKMPEQKAALCQLPHIFTESWNIPANCKLKLIVFLSDS